jgi:hypothetical protein
VAGVVPGVGVFVYVIARGRWPRLFQTPWYALAALVVVALVGGFYALREWTGPGYLAAVMNNELAGRYLHGMSGHIEPASYYLFMVFYLFAFGPLLGLLFISPFLRWKPSKSAAFLVYANCVIVAFFLVYSLSPTKIFWYLAPIYPILSIAIAVVIERLLRMLPYRPDQPVQTAPILIAIAALYLAGNAVAEKLVLLPRRENIPQGRYGQVFAELAKQGFHRISVIDGGVDNNDSLNGYAPQLRFYALAWGERGLDVRQHDPAGPPALDGDRVLVTCDQGYLAQARALGRPVADVPGCAAVSPSNASRHARART